MLSDFLGSHRRALFGVHQTNKRERCWFYSPRAPPFLDRQAALRVAEHLVSESAGGDTVPLGEIFRFGPLLRRFRVVANGCLTGNLRVQNQQFGERYVLHTDSVALANLDQLVPVDEIHDPLVLPWFCLILGIGTESASCHDDRGIFLTLQAPQHADFVDWNRSSSPSFCGHDSSGAHDTSLVCHARICPAIASSLRDLNVLESERLKNASEECGLERAPVYPLEPRSNLLADSLVLLMNTGFDFARDRSQNEFARLAKSDPPALFTIARSYEPSALAGSSSRRWFSNWIAMYRDW